MLARAHAIYFFRPLFTRATAAFALFAAALYLIGREVWVARVLENMPKTDVLALARFFLAAFEHTHHFALQGILLIALAALLWLAREFARLLAAPVHRFA